MDGFRTKEELERELARMRQKDRDLENCHAEFLEVQQRYEHLLQSAPDAMVFVSSDSRIVLMNAQLLKLFGYEEDELIGRHLDFLIPERFREHHKEHVAEYFASPRVRSMGTNLNIYGLRKDGTEFPADISLSPIETEGGIVAVAAIRDVTERKQAEEEKERLRQQLAEVEKLSALGRIAANVADEIRNPLTAVGGFARRLLKVVDSEKEKKYAEYIIEEVGRLEGVLRDVLAYSRTRSLNIGRYDLVSVIEEELKEWEERFAERSVMIMRSYGGSSDVKIDAVQTREAINRLITNAVEAMPKGGTLHVMTDTELVKGVPYVRLRLRDTGAGIPADKLGMVFEPFFTMRSTKRGSGLGLPVAKSIVEEQGGLIRIESAVGEGTTVTLLFPDIRE